LTGRHGSRAAKAAVAALVGSIAVPLSVAAASWVIVSSPNPSASQFNRLYGVTCPGPGQCWAVGASAITVDQTLIEQDTGNGWAIVSSPNTSSSQNNGLKGVTCAGASDCWAVGGAANGSVGNDQTLIEQDTGSGWAIVSSPNTSTNQDNSLNGVSCVSANDCWAVGAHSNGSNAQTLIEQNTGTGWAIVSSPDTSSSQNNYLEGVTCASASDCWAVGFSFSSSPIGGLVDQTLIEAWDGTSWSIVSSPNSASGPSQLTGVTCVSASDCWTVGYSNGIVDQTLIEQNTGSGWAVVTSPDHLGSQTNFLNGVACVSAAECWAIGSYSTSSVDPTGTCCTIDQTLIESWDGTSWSIVGSPSTSSSQNNYLYSVTCASAADCRAVGAAATNGYQTLIEQDTGPSAVVPEWPNGALSWLVAGLGMLLVVMSRRTRRNLKRAFTSPPAAMS
jgi:hypothetical protein